MTSNRRSFLKLATAAAVAPMLPAPAKAPAFMGYGFGEPALSDALALIRLHDVAMGELRDQICAAFNVPAHMVFDLPAEMQHAVTGNSLSFLPLQG